MGNRSPATPAPSSTVLESTNSSAGAAGEPVTLKNRHAAPVWVKRMVREILLHPGVASHANFHGVTGFDATQILRNNRFSGQPSPERGRVRMSPFTRRLTPLGSPGSRVEHQEDPPRSGGLPSVRRSARLRIVSQLVSQRRA